VAVTVLLLDGADRRREVFGGSAATTATAPRRRSAEPSEFDAVTDTRAADVAVPAYVEAVA
jgi:hypothetical protein